MPMSPTAATLATIPITDVPAGNSLATLCVAAADAAYAGEPAIVAAAMTQADSIAGQWRNILRIDVLWFGSGNRLVQ